jgi:hypothetical protein
MINHLIRRTFQLTFLTLAFMVGMYFLLYITVGGPQCILTRTPKPASCTSRASNIQLWNYFHWDRPELLRYLTFLVGDDWLGADWVYLGLGNYRYPVFDENGQQLIETNWDTGEKTPQWNYARFWTDPGPVLINPGYIIWVWGEQTGLRQYHADSIHYNPPSRAAMPEGVITYGRVIKVVGSTITFMAIDHIRSTVSLDQNTTYTFPVGEGLPRPREGLWLNISWLTGTTGLLGQYSGFHGTYHGILRLDFGEAWVLKVDRFR